MNLNEFTKSKKAKKVLGRGIGSGKGKTAGRGHKGQKARAGATVNGFEGGQMPIFRRLPKRGFNNINRIEYQVVNTGTVQEFISSGVLNAKKTIDKTVLLAVGIIKKPALPVKLLAKGEIKEAVKIEVDKASKTAIKAIEKAKGSVKTLAVTKEKKETKAA